MNDLVAQLLGEATSRIWDRLDNYLKEGVLDNYLKEGVGVGKKEKNYHRIPTGSVNQLSPSQTAKVTIKPNGERKGQTLQKQYCLSKKQILLFPPQPQNSTCAISSSALTVKSLS